MQQGRFVITENRPLTKDVREMTLAGDVSAFTRPGQFAQIRVPGRSLRRPISVCRLEKGSLTLVYKVVGSGTEDMARMAPGTCLDLLTGLGNGFDPSLSGDRPVLIGGGVGVPPLFELARVLLKAGRNVTVILGFNTKSEIFYHGEFEALGARVRLTTADGSEGVQGFVTSAVSPEDRFTRAYACGPEPMLRAVSEALDCPCSLSFESRMGCGFGACMGCSCRTLTGYKRICKEGPVLEKEEILWPTRE